MIDRFKYSTFLPLLTATSPLSFLSNTRGPNRTKLEELSQDMSGPWKVLSTKISPRTGITTIKYQHVPSSTLLWVRDSQITLIEGNLSRLYSGEDDNLHVLSSQSEIDSAISNLKVLLLAVTDCELSGEFVLLEFGGVVHQPMSQFYHLLHQQTHPSTRSVARHHKQSLLWGSSQSKDLYQISIYDKGREVNGKKGRKNSLPVDQFTRIELILSNKKLRKLMGGPVVHPDFQKLREVFYAELYKFDRKAGIPIEAVDGSLASLLAILENIPEKHRQENGVDLLDLWKATKNPQHLRRLETSARAYNFGGAVTRLEDLLPADPACLFTQLETLLPANLRRAS
jgi:hypothetical protein